MSTSPSTKKRNYKIDEKAIKSLNFLLTFIILAWLIDAIYECIDHVFGLNSYPTIKTIVFILTFIFWNIILGYYSDHIFQTNIGRDKWNIRYLIIVGIWVIIMYIYLYNRA